MITYEKVKATLEAEEADCRDGCYEMEHVLRVLRVFFVCGKDVVVNVAAGIVDFKKCELPAEHEGQCDATPRTQDEPPALQARRPLHCPTGIGGRYVGQRMKGALCRLCGRDYEAHKNT